jgi:hypothetical protein
MACDCGETYKRTFPARNEFKVYFDRDYKTVPVWWGENLLYVCICCGDITGRVPDRELQVLKAGAGESMT